MERPLRKLKQAGIATLIALTTTVAFSATDTIERTFDVSDGGLLTLDSDSGSVTIETWNKDQVGIVVERESRKKESLDEYIITLKNNGTDVNILGEAPRRTRISINYTIQVPENYNLKLKTGGGNIRVADLTGDVDVNTSGGSINIGYVDGPSVRADTSGGNITISGATGSVFADTSGGSITIGDVGGDLDVDTSGGGIQLGAITGTALIETSGGNITVAQGGESVEADTSGGSIEVGPTNGDVDVNTSGGNIRIDTATGNVKADTSGGSIKVAKSGGNVEIDSSGGSLTVDGAAGYVEADTSGGNITLRDIMGYIEADTSGGRIEATLLQTDNSVDTHVSLSSSGGDLILTLPAEIAATLDAQIRITRSASRDYEIISDFPVEVTGEGSSKVKGTGNINGGGDKLVLRTTNGDIYIRILN